MTDREHEWRLASNAASRQLWVRLASPTGWEVSAREDDRIVATARFDDWHRVELALVQLSSDRSSTES